MKIILPLQKKVVELAHKNKAHVQGEIGTLPNFKADDNPLNLTDPMIAKQFIKNTKIDFLGVSIGNVHLHSNGKYKPNIELLSKINNQVDVPLVIHGTTGFPENQIIDAIKNGVSMFQVGTIIKNTFYNEVKNFIENINTISDIHEVVGSRKNTDYLESGKTEIIKLITKYIRLFNSQNKKYLYG